MEQSLNRLEKDLNEIATQHKQINDYFFGSFHDAITRDAVNYPLMCVTLQPGGKSDNVVRVNMVITLADKYHEGNHTMKKEIYSDLLQVSNDIYVTLKQNKFEDYLSITSDVSDDPFDNRGEDLTVGYETILSVDIWNQECWQGIPYTTYDFEN